MILLRDGITTSTWQRLKVVLLQCLFSIALIVCCRTSFAMKIDVSGLDAERSAQTSTSLVEKERKLLSREILLIAPNIMMLREDGNFSVWTAEALIDTLLPKLNSTSLLLAQEYNKNKTELSVPYQPVTYVKNKVTHPWQIVLIPLSEQKAIRVKAYGSDLIAPVFEEDISIR